MCSQTASGWAESKSFTGGSLLFAGATAHICADGLRGDVLRAAMQPTGQHRAIHELSGAFREGDEHPLGYVFSEVRIETMRNEAE